MDMNKKIQEMADKFIKDKSREIIENTKNELSKVKCPVCGQSPQLEISGNEILLKNLCCKALKDEVKKIQDTLSIKDK